MRNAASKTTSEEQVVAPTTAENVDEYRATLASVLERCDQIKRWSDRYPVHLILAGQVHKFKGADDVDKFIARLKSEIASYELAHGARRASG
jgi:hypothetical protein